MKFVTENLRIKSIRPVSTPAQVQAELPLSEVAARTTYEARSEIQAILAGRDDRLLVIVGHCSIHDTRAAMEYAARLKADVEDASAFGKEAGKTGQQERRREADGGVEQ